MDYEQAYKAVLKTATQWIKDGCSDKEKICLESVFPELRESEDERIRKELISQVEKSRHHPADKARWLAWLEKQKESAWTEEDENFRKHILPRILDPKGWSMELIDADKERLKEFVERQKNKWAEKQKEQKPAEWSEDWREEDIQTRFAFYTYKDDSSVLYLSNVFVEEASRNHGFGTRILRAAEKVAETIGAITICLKVKQDSPANAWYRKNGYGYVAFEDGYDWLEKNLEYLKPAKSTEWSEEDEDMLNLIVETLDDNSHYFPFKETKKKMIDWLKSLRPYWKPSEEHLNALLAVLNDPNNIGSQTCQLALTDLYDQLKKL